MRLCWQDLEGMTFAGLSVMTGAGRSDRDETAEHAGAGNAVGKGNNQTIALIPIPFELVSLTKPFRPHR